MQKQGGLGGLVSKAAGGLGAGWARRKGDVMPTVNKGRR